MLLYLAGPDVFSADALEKAAELKSLCQTFGYESLFPLDNKISDYSHDRSTAIKIYMANIAMIRRADALLANAMPFRGFSADVGTVYEIGFARALEKPVALYSTDLSSYIDRCKRKLSLTLDGTVLRDKNAMEVEDFGLPDNLMFTSEVPVFPSPNAALAYLAEKIPTRPPK